MVFTSAASDSQERMLEGRQDEGRANPADSQHLSFSPHGRSTELLEGPPDLAAGISHSSPPGTQAETAMSLMTWPRTPHSNYHLSTHVSPDSLWKEQHQGRGAQEVRGWGVGVGGQLGGWPPHQEPEAQEVFWKWKGQLHLQRERAGFSVGRSCQNWS